MGSVVAVCVSEQKGTPKHPVPALELRLGWGIVGTPTPETGIGS